MVKSCVVASAATAVPMKLGAAATPRPRHATTMRAAVDSTVDFLALSSTTIAAMLNRMSAPTEPSPCHRTNPVSRMYANRPMTLRVRLKQLRTSMTPVSARRVSHVAVPVSAWLLCHSSRAVPAPRALTQAAEAFFLNSATVIKTAHTVATMSIAFSFRVLRVSRSARRRPRTSPTGWWGGAARRRYGGRRRTCRSDRGPWRAARCWRPWRRRSTR